MILCLAEWRLCVCHRQAGFPNKGLLDGKFTMMELLILSLSVSSRVTTVPSQYKSWIFTGQQFHHVGVFNTPLLHLSLPEWHLCLCDPWVGFSLGSNFTMLELLISWSVAEWRLCVRDPGVGFPSGGRDAGWQVHHSGGDATEVQG